LWGVSGVEIHHPPKAPTRSYARMALTSPDAVKHDVLVLYSYRNASMG
jgi:hypothetical protein